MTKNKKPIPWSELTIREMYGDQKLGPPLSLEPPLDYLIHKREHAEGKGKKMPRGKRTSYGYREIFWAITPEGLGNWEHQYMKRIMAGEKGSYFEKEIMNSPLPGGTKKNLIENMRNR